MWKEDINVINKINTVLKTHEEQNVQAVKNKLFYHYTNPAGLLGIFQSASLWATHFRFLNDVTEFEYGIETIFKVLEEYLETQELKDSEIKLITQVFLLQKSLEEKNFNAYIACFCTNGDLLSQWRGYAGSSGYAIGFTGDIFNDKDYVDNIEKNTNVRWEFGKVYYGSDAEELVRDLIPYCVEIVKSYLIEYPTGSTRTGSIEFIQTLSSLKMLFYQIPFFSKHGGFKEGWLYCCFKRKRCF